MKKIIALILASVFLFAVCSCDSGKDTGAVTTAGTEAPETTSGKNEDPSTEALFGTVKGNTYENEFLALSYTVADGWTFYSQEQIAEINGLAKDYMDKAADLVNTSSAVTVMFAANSDGTQNVNICLEKLSSDIDLEETLNSTLPALESTYENMGATDVSFTVTADEDDPNQAVIIGEADFGGSVKMYTMSLNVKYQGYLVSVNIVSAGEDKTADILEGLGNLD